MTVIRPSELDSAHIALWSRFQAEDRALASPFFHPEFTLAVADVRDDVYVAVMEDAQNIIGFFPFQRRRLPVGAPVGGARSNYHGVIGPAGAEWDPVELIRGCGLRVWDFDHLPVSQKPFCRFHTGRGDSYYVDLSDGFEPYARARREAGSREIPRMREKARRMEREVGPLRFEHHASDPDVLHMMMKWKSRQYRRTRRVDNFAIAWNVRLLERLHSTRVDGLQGMLVALYSGDTLAAVEMGLRSGPIFHSWFPAYNVELARYSPGLVRSLFLLEAAESVGLRTLDLGKDHQPYKERIATDLIPLAEGAVLVPSAVATARRARRAIEGVVRRTPLSEPARAALRRARSGGARSQISRVNLS